MSKTQVVGMMSDWSGVIRDMFRQIHDGSLTLPHMRAFLEHRNPFITSDIRAEWAEFYRKYFRLTVDFSAVPIPDDPGGFSRIIFIPAGLKLSQVVAAMKKKFDVWTYVDDLDGNVTENSRTSDKSYAVRCRERVEADEELKSRSANWLKEQNVNSLTLLERLVNEL